MAKKKKGDSEENNGDNSNKKQKLFIPRKIDERRIEWNNMQPIMNIDGEEVRINQEDEKGMQGYWKDPVGRYVIEGFYINGKKRVQQSNIEILSFLEVIRDKVYHLSNLADMNYLMVFHLDGKELLKRRSPRIPKVGENVILEFSVIDECLEFVKKYFLEQAIKINDIIPIENDLYSECSDAFQYFNFEVESVASCYFGNDFEFEEYEQYYVKLAPKLKKSVKNVWNYTYDLRP
jgi:hypothetical protein